MIGCAGPFTFVAFALFFVLTLVLLRVGVAGHAPARPPARPVVLVRAQTPPYDWEREGL